MSGLKIIQESCEKATFMPELATLPGRLLACCTVPSNLNFVFVFFVRY
jgi:hypothetical protein